MLTTDSLAVIESDDVLDPSWIESCLRALSRRPAMAFAGTWGRCEGRVVTSTLDLVPELYPFRSARATWLRVTGTPQPRQILLGRPL